MAINAQTQGEARAVSPNPVERAIEQFQRVRSGSVERSRSVEAILDQKVEQLFQRLSGQIQGLAIENGLLKASVEVLKSSLAQSELGHQESLSTLDKAHQEATSVLRGQMELKQSALEKELADLKKDHLSLQQRFRGHLHEIYSANIHLPHCSFTGKPASAYTGFDGYSNA